MGEGVQSVDAHGVEHLLDIGLTRADVATDEGGKGLGHG
jgi:hypothetical protein